MGKNFEHGHRLRTREHIARSRRYNRIPSSKLTAPWPPVIRIISAIRVAIFDHADALSHQNLVVLVEVVPVSWLPTFAFSQSAPTK